MTESGRPDDEYDFENLAHRSDDPEGGVPGGSAVPVPPPVPAFCLHCGSALNGVLPCQNCAENQRRTSAHRATLKERDSASFASAVALYFVLLSSFAVMFFDPGNVYLEISVGIIDALIVLCWVIIHRKHIVPIMKLPSNPAWLLGGLLAGVLTFAVTTLFLRVVSVAFGLPIIDMTDSYTEAGFSLAVPLMMIVLQPAIVEEFAFRGVIFKVLEQHLTLKEAMLVSSCMFAALHLSPLAFPHTFLIGILAVTLLHRTGSIWPGVLLHGMHNFLVIAEELWLR